MVKIFFQFIINSENIFNSIKIYLIFFYHFTINSTQLNTTQHNTTQHNTTQHNTTQHNTTQHKK